MRSGFPPWVHPAQPGFGRNPRGDFGTGEGCVPWHGPAIIGVLQAGWLSAGRRDAGSTRPARRGKGSQHPRPGMWCCRDRPLPPWAVCQCLCTLWESPATQMFHVAAQAGCCSWGCNGALRREDPSGRVDLGRGEAEEGDRLSLGVAEEAEVPHVPPPSRVLPAPRQMSSLPHFGRRGVKPKHPS